MKQQSIITKQILCEYFKTFKIDETRKMFVKWTIFSYYLNNILMLLNCSVLLKPLLFYIFKQCYYLKPITLALFIYEEPQFSKTNKNKKNSNLKDI